MDEMWSALTPPYRCIVGDPPWEYRRLGPRRGADKSRRATPGKPWPYSQMSVDAIALLPVEELAAPDARLFLWTTPRYLHEAFHICEAWGFKPGMTFTWIKKPRGTQAVTTEFLIRASRGSPPAIPWRNSTWFDWARPAGHSQKPAAAYDLIEEQSERPRLELFARQVRLGWHGWGMGVEREPEAM